MYALLRSAPYGITYLSKNRDVASFLEKSGFLAFYGLAGLRGILLVVGMLCFLVIKYIFASSSGQSVNLCSDVVQNGLFSSAPQHVHFFLLLSIISKYPKCILHSLSFGLKPPGIVFGSGKYHPQNESGTPVYGLTAPRFKHSF